MLLDVFVECDKNNELTVSMKQGLISLIPKPCKDLLYLSDWAKKEDSDADRQQ